MTRFYANLIGVSLMLGTACAVVFSAPAPAAAQDEAPEVQSGGQIPITAVCVDQNTIADMSDIAHPKFAPLFIDADGDGWTVVSDPDEKTNSVLGFFPHKHPGLFCGVVRLRKEPKV